MGEVWTLDLPRSERDVLLALADHAHDDGTSVKPGVPYLTWKTDLARSTVISALRSLEEKTIIVPVLAGGGRGNVTEYRLDLAKSPRKPPFDAKRPKIGRITKPSDPPETVRSTDDKPSDSRSLVPALDLEPSLGTTPPISPPAKVDRRAVSAVEADLAVAVLAEWNRQTDQNLRSRDWLAKIVMRIREYPDLVLVDHAHVIAAALAKPWWKGDANPSVVYGNGAQFERSILTAAGRPNGQPQDATDRSRVNPAGGPTPDALIERARALAEAGR